jgi:hypothetical protein
MKVSPVLDQQATWGGDFSIIWYVDSRKMEWFLLVTFGHFFSDPLPLLLPLRLGSDTGMKGWSPAVLARCLDFGAVFSNFTFTAVDFPRRAGGSCVDMLEQIPGKFEKGTQQFGGR